MTHYRTREIPKPVDVAALGTRLQNDNEMTQFGKLRCDHDSGWTTSNDAHIGVKPHSVKQRSVHLRHGILTISSVPNFPGRFTDTYRTPER
jgi:hypothetical protein